MASRESSQATAKNPLSNEELRLMDAWWRACNYLAVGMIYLRANPLLREPLKPEHIKYRLLGHWGASPALSFVWTHLNRLIKRDDLDVIFIAGPGHGAPGVLGPAYLEGTYSEIYPDKSEDIEGLQKFLMQFSFPGHIGSHCTPETPGSIHEGGELGYSLAHAYGAALDNPDLIVACVVGDGESETGPLATAWHSNKFLNPIRDGAVLPILNLNGYKIANPTLPARITHEELESLLVGYGYKPHFVEGSEPSKMHQAMAATLDAVIAEIRSHQKKARDSGKAERPRWPMIVLRTPKGWTGPKEFEGHKLEGSWRAHQAIYEVSKKTWMAEMIADDADGGELARDGRVMEMLSEHTLMGWLEGYLLTGRHGFFATYEAFAHVVDSMFNQHAKWLDIAKNHVRWRTPVAAQNILLSSTVWRQDHNGFSHQDPGFIDIVTNKSPSVTRVYLPPDANTLLVVADQCLRSTDCINVIVADKQKHLQFSTIDEAVVHCAKGIGIWRFASNDQGAEPDVVMACCGDVPTAESLAATAILRQHLPDLKVRFVNVVDLFRLMPATEHPHGSSEREFDSLFTRDKPVIFNFHGYPLVIHKLAYRFANHDNLHVRGYKEKGNINTPLELAIVNQIDRFDLVIDVIDRVPGLAARAAHLKEEMKNAIIDSLTYAHAEGRDRPEIADWVWPG